LGTRHSWDHLDRPDDISHGVGREESLQALAAGGFTTIDPSSKHPHYWDRRIPLLRRYCYHLECIFPNKTVTWWTTAIFVGFALLSLFMIADYFVGHHHVSEDGLSYGRLTGPRGYLKWTDLHIVRYAEGMKWFRLENKVRRRGTRLSNA
jgi:hypothetical protein